MDPSFPSKQNRCLYLCTQKHSNHFKYIQNYAGCFSCSSEHNCLLIFISNFPPLTELHGTEGLFRLGLTNIGAALPGFVMLRDSSRIMDSLWCFLITFMLPRSNINWALTSALLPLASQRYHPQPGRTAGHTVHMLAGPASLAVRCGPPSS